MTEFVKYNYSGIRTHDLWFAKQELYLRSTEAVKLTASQIFIRDINSWLTCMHKPGLSRSISILQNFFNHVLSIDIRHFRHDVRQCHLTYMLLYPTTPLSNKNFLIFSYSYLIIALVLTLFT